MDSNFARRSMLSEALLPLDCLPSGQWADVAEVFGEPSWVSRMAELGIRNGCRLQMVQGGSPCMLQIAGCRLCLRSDAASQILVRPLDRLSDS
jgi:ferrous iron transport protein A